MPNHCDSTYVEESNKCGPNLSKVLNALYATEGETPYRSLPDKKMVEKMGVEDVRRELALLDYRENGLMYHVLYTAKLVTISGILGAYKKEGVMGLFFDVLLSKLDPKARGEFLAYYFAGVQLLPHVFMLEERAIELGGGLRTTVEWMRARVLEEARKSLKALQGLQASLQSLAVEVLPALI